MARSVRGPPTRFDCAPSLVLTSLGLNRAARLRALLIDLSGTVHVGDAATPNAAQALDKLRKAGVALRFVSNTSKESRAGLFAGQACFSNR